jgi:hypothetical protein
MHLGDPYKFSVVFEPIYEWSDNTYTNGVLLLIIDGKLFPKEEVSTAELNVDINFLQRSLTNITINDGIYTMKKEKAFIEIYNSAPTIVDNNFQIAPCTLSDRDYCIFAMGNGKQIRIIGTKLVYNWEESTHCLNDLDISEAFITYNELNQILYGLDKWKDR